MNKMLKLLYAGKTMCAFLELTANNSYTYHRYFGEYEFGADLLLHSGNDLEIMLLLIVVAEGYEL